MNDIKEKESDIAKIVLPEKDEEDETTKRTKAALEAIINSKISSGKVVTAAAKAAEKEEPNYIRYTPNPSAPGTYYSISYLSPFTYSYSQYYLGYKPEVKQRVIKMVEAQVDPMEPAKQTTVKASKPGADAPVPVLHAPSKKLTVAEKQAWDIPACVSNWKNPNGYTIALDKRLAGTHSLTHSPTHSPNHSPTHSFTADGRGLQETTINNKFAMLSEGLYVAERKAAEDLHVRNQLRKKMAMKEKEDKESMLREIAAKARMERAGIATDNGNTNDVGGDRYSDDDGGDEEGREERERLRVERRKERERELRYSLTQSLTHSLTHSLTLTHSN
jgi:SNW domain-containing protein 1